MSWVLEEESACAGVGRLGLGVLQKRLYKVDGIWPELWDKIQRERQGIRTDVGK